LIAAILAAAMSNLSAALNSLSSSSIMDFYLRFRAGSRSSPAVSEAGRLRLARLATVAWALVLFGLAVLALHRVGRVVEVGLQIASVAYGALLGVFLLGVLTKRANQRGAMVGMICGLADGTVFVGMVAGGFHLVGRDRNLRDVCGGIRCQRSVEQVEAKA
jgi:SSS family solute:Na+ symporter